MVSKGLAVTHIVTDSYRDISIVDLIFLETSAKTGENVEEAFLKCSKTILAKIEAGELDPERVGSGIQYGGNALRVTEPKTRKLSNCCRI